MFNAAVVGGHEILGWVHLLFFCLITFSYCLSLSACAGVCTEMVSEPMLTSQDARITDWHKGHIWNMKHTLLFYICYCCDCSCVTLFLSLQILYASEGENKKTSDRNDESKSLMDKLGATEYKGHDFLSIHFRTPTSCEACNKPVWHMIHPPTALECRRKLSSVIVLSWL